MKLFGPNKHAGIVRLVVLADAALAGWGVAYLAWVTLVWIYD